ncbi:unnamed protein product [Caenorhabditis sp. 36 PRJEB53466]|nr:unnamed protein product [Caenorhabditis sp. 36 PRJEB53466]
MKSSTSKEKLCGENSRQVFNKLVNAQKSRFDINAIGMIHLIDELDRLRKLWKQAEEAKKQTIGEMRDVEEQLAKARKELEMSALDVKDHKKHLRAMMEENKALKLDLNVLETREKQLKNAMKNGAFDSLTKADREQFAFLREPLQRNHSKRVQLRYPHLMEETQEEEDDSEVDYDETGDSFEDVMPLRNGREVRKSGNQLPKRRSSSAHATPILTNAGNAKRSRSRVITATIDEEPNESGTPPKRGRSNGTTTQVTTTTSTTTTILNREFSRRSMSCDNMTSMETPSRQANNLSIRTKSTVDVRTLKKGTPAWTDGSSRDIAHRTHTFVDGGINPMRKCDKCDALILAKSFKCTDCHQVVHKDCSSRLRLPCIPRPKAVMTPKSAGRNYPKVQYTLQDFCTSAKPMIPSSVVHCVVALEARGLTTEGIYRVPGSTKTVSALLEELRSAKSVPNVALHDVEVIADTLKRFLRELRDPLIPRSSRQELISAAKTYWTDPDNGRLALNRVICELPQANRDTLAYLFIHWRKVISRAEFNNMNIDNMARILSVAVMGPMKSVLQSSQTEARYLQDCERTLKALFEFDDGYWQRFLGALSTRTAVVAEPMRHESVALCDRSILGPVTTSPATPLLSRAPKNVRRGAHLLGPMRDD